MDKIRGISINDLQIQMGFVGVLLFHEFPVTSIFSENNIPIIKEWVDCNDEVDRFLIYKSSTKILKQFIDGEINHLGLLKHAIDGLIYIVDEKDGENISVIINSISQIPDEYVPSEQSFFSFKDGVETQKIIDFFDLDKVELSGSDYVNHIETISKIEHSDIFNLHLKKGKGISFGSIDTDVLGSALLNFDNLYNEIALDYYFGQNRGMLKIPKEDKKEKIKLSRTVVFLNEAASFSVFLKAKHYSQIDLFEDKTELQIIADKLFSLFNITQNEVVLNNSYLMFSDFVYKSYKSFLNNIVKNEIKLDLSWVNSKKAEIYIEDFSLVKANGIIEIIENIHTETKDKFKKKGKFRAINCNTGYFTFVSLEEAEYHGYFDKLIKDVITLLNFTNIYEITIERRIVKEAGDKEPNIYDTIIAYYDIKE